MTDHDDAFAWWEYPLIVIAVVWWLIFGDERDTMNWSEWD